MLSEKSYWQTVSILRYSLIIFLLLMGVLVIAAIAFFTSSLWIIEIALPYTIVSPLLCYSRVYDKYNRLVQHVLPFLLLILSMTVIIFYGPLLTPAPLLFLASIEFMVAVTLIMSMMYLLCMRYLIVKLGE